MTAMLTTIIIVLIALVVGSLLGTTIISRLNSSHSFKRIGFVSWSNKRGSSNIFRSILHNADKSLDILVSWGGSIPTLSPIIEETLQEKVRHGCDIRVLVLKPGSLGEMQRRRDRKQWPPGQPETDIRNFLAIKESLGPLGGSLRVALYEERPVWSMIIGDRCVASIGYYGQGIGRNNPEIEVRKKGDEKSFLDAFRMEYERLWGTSQEIYTLSDFEQMLPRLRERIGKAFVLVIVGPPGIGKTAVADFLVRDGRGVHGTILTTRPTSLGQSRAGQFIHVSQEEFQKLSDNGKILAERTFAGYRYGITQETVYETISDRFNPDTGKLEKAGKILILDTIISPLLLKQRLGSQVSTIFLLPRSFRFFAEKAAVRAGVSIEQFEKTVQPIMNECSICDYAIVVDEDPSYEFSKLRFIVENLEQSYATYRDLCPKELEPMRAIAVIQTRGGVF